METLGLLATGFSVALTPLNILLLLVGCFCGTLIGALPGLGPVNGVAILIPLTFAFRLDATSSLILLSAVYFGCMYGGRISSILLNIPGDEPAVMTTLDGFPMAQQGRAADALAISGVASFIGATFAIIGLSLFAPMLARAAIYFGPADYFALYVLAFATIGGVAGVDPAKDRRKFVIDFLGGPLAELGDDQQVKANITVSNGKLEEEVLQTIDPGSGLLRLVVEVSADAGAVVEMSADLWLEERRLSETWIYQWLRE